MGERGSLFRPDTKGQEKKGRWDGHELADYFRYRLLETQRSPGKRKRKREKALGGRAA